MVLGTLLALAMRLMSKPVRLLVQTGLLLAWAMPVLAALTVWQWLFDSQYGVVNWLLERVGLDYAGHSWLIEPLSFFFVAAVVVVWMSVPFVAFTVYAGLIQLPAEIIEAAEVDGASAFQRLRHVILPLTRPVLLIVGLLQVIWDLRVFTQIYVLQNAGGVTRETNLLGTYIYRSGIGEGNFGVASAVAVFMLALTVVLTWPYVAKMLKDVDHEPHRSSPYPTRGRRPRPRRLPAVRLPGLLDGQHLLPRPARDPRPRPDLAALRRRARQLPAALRRQRLHQRARDQPRRDRGHRRGGARSSPSSRRWRSPASASAGASRSWSRCSSCR